MAEPDPDEPKLRFEGDEHTSALTEASETSEVLNVSPDPIAELTDTTITTEQDTTVDTQDITADTQDITADTHGPRDDSDLHSGDSDQVSSLIPDAETTEFLYYSTTLREIAPKLTNEVDRHLVIPWIRKLFQLEYHSVLFRSKRNKYLLHLILLVMNDEAWGIVRDPPPEGALRPVETLANRSEEWKAEWERDRMWQETLKGLPGGIRIMKCTVHTDPDVCKNDEDHFNQFDQEFTFLLYLTRPYCVLLRNASERTTAASWLQTLCTIRPDSCTPMKRIRNEYIMALLGYVHELRLAGPFSELPWNPLPPLANVARTLADKRPIIDPCSHEADEFLTSQPMPEDGAFCYMAITGDLFDTSLDELD